MDTTTGLTMPANPDKQLSEKQLSDEQSRSVAALVREELARRRISRQHLADQAKISISTLEKAFSGRRPFTLATTIRLEEALGVSLRKANLTAPMPPRPPVSLAPGELGFYSRPAVSFIEDELPDAAAVLRRPRRHLRLPHRDLLGCRHARA